MNQKMVLVFATVLVWSLVFLSFSTMTGLVSLQQQNKADILVKFAGNPDFSQEASALFARGLIKSKYLSITELDKKYNAESFRQLFKQAKGLDNTFELKVKGDPSEIIAAFKADPNVEYARVSEPEIETSVAADIKKINDGLKKEGQNWKADYTLQSIMTLEDRQKLVGVPPQGKGVGGGASATCSDTDNGKNYSERGTACVGPTCYTDNCSGTKLTEYYCNKNNLGSASYSCPYGCVNGACSKCVPNCAGKQCGTDGCGGSCGNCQPGQSCSNGTCTGTSTIPSSLDWRNKSGKNYVSPVKNQSSCGSCWAFAVVGAQEAEINAYYNQAINKNLAEQDLVSCAFPYPTGGYGGCEGYYPDQALSYAQKTGLVEESCLPYTATDSPCTKCSTGSQNEWKIASWSSVNMTENDIKLALATKGPLVTEMYVYDDFFYYSGGIYSRTTGATYQGSHAIVIVGYGTDSSGKNFWIVKNSWGTGWGEAGFFRIYAGQVGIDSMAVMSISSPVPPSTQPQIKVCEDKDADGYCNWGLGTKPSADCPVCGSAEDCDDSNQGLNTSC